MYDDHAILRDWARWLTNGRERSNGAGLVVTLNGATDNEVKMVEEILLRQGIDAHVYSTKPPAGGKPDAGGGPYAMLMNQLLRARAGSGTGEVDGRKPKKRDYFALVDDDVFFPSMGRLVHTLKTRFDPAKPYYIGIPSEQSDWFMESGKLMTYGGGAVFLTAPMLDEVGQLLCLQEGSHGARRRSSLHERRQITNDDYDDDPASWDGLLYRCIARNTDDVALHIIPGLYDPSAVAETYSVSQGHRRVIRLGYGTSTVQPLALHHYRNFHRLDAGLGHTVASVCGEECFLQRFLFDDGWVLVNGHTLTKYAEEVETVTPVETEPKARDEQTPVTKDDDEDDDEEVNDNDNNDSSSKTSTAAEPRVSLVVAPLQSDKGDEALPTQVRAQDRKTIAWHGTRRTFRLLDARVRDNGEVWQVYANRKGRRGNVNQEDYGGGGVSRSEEEDQRRHREEEKADVDSLVVLIWEPER
jgi:hypothetical protein